MISDQAIAVRAVELRSMNKTLNTRRTYAKWWWVFCDWCSRAKVQSLPATRETIERYITVLTLEEYPETTIALRLSAIGYYHRQAHLPDPTHDVRVKEMMAGVRSYYAGRITAAKAALSLDHIRKGLCRKPVKALEYRDRALILVGHSCGLRRSLLVGIDYEHLIFESNGHVRIVLPQGRIISLSPRRVDCPVKALRAWLELSGIKGGAVFVSVDRHGNLGGRIRGETVARIVKKIARAAGLNPGQFSADSLAKRDCGV